MARGKARFGGADRVQFTDLQIADLENAVKSAICEVIPAIVEDGDFESLIQDIQGAAYLAKRMLVEGRMNSSVPDIKAELAKLLRWIDRGELDKAQEAFPSISQDVWWALKTAENSDATPRSVKERAVAALNSDIENRPKPAETSFSAGKLLVQRLRSALYSHQVSLNITLTAYYNPDYGHMLTLVQLAEAIGSAIGLHLSLLRWKNIAQGVLSEGKNGVDGGSIP